MTLPIAPTFSTIGGEWNIAPVQSSAAPSGGFADALGGQIQQLSATQTDAASQSQALAVGDATDPAAVVMAVERAQLEMQMATTIRNKGVEAIQELMRTQV